MSKESIDKIKRKLTEIKVIGGKPDNITFKELGEIIFLFKSESNLASLETTMLDYYKNYKKYSLFSYCLGIYYYLMGKNGDTYINNFFNQLMRYGKNSLLYLISMEILKIYESEYVLTFLSDYYQKIDKKNELIDVWKRLLNKNPYQYNLMIKIADANSKTNLDESLKYYQLAFLKEFESKNYSTASSILKKIINLNYNEEKIILPLIKKIIVYLKKEDSISLLIFYLKNLEKDLKKNFTEFIKVIKLSLENNILLKSQFSKLLDSYKIKYQKHKNFDNILRLSKMKNLTKSTTYNIPSKVIELIKEFEKYIIFDEESFVYHRNFGVGLIKKIYYEKIGEKFNAIKFSIDFKRKKKHLMSFRIAINSLVILKNDNLEAITLFTPDAVNDLKQDLKRFITSLLHTLDSPASNKDITELVVNKLSLFTKEEWKAKWNEIKSQLNQNKGLLEQFELTAKGIQFKTKSISLEKNILDALNTRPVKDVIKLIDFNLMNHQLNEKTTLLIVKKFLSQIKNIESGNLARIVFLHYLNKAFNIQVEEDLKKLFKENFNESKTIREFSYLNNFSQRQLFIEFWYSNFPEDFSAQLKDYWIANEISFKEIPLEYLLTVNMNQFQSLFEYINNEYSKYAEAFFLMFKLSFNYNEEYFETKLGSYLVKLLRINYDLHNNLKIEKEVAFSKRIYSTIYNYLFKDNFLFTLLTTSNKLTKENKEAIFSELEKQTFLENYLKVEIKTLHAKFK